MRRADRRRRLFPSRHRPRRLTQALAAAFPLWVTLSAGAQSPVQAGSPTDVRYTTPIGAEQALFPRAPGESAGSGPTVVPGADYAANAAVGRVVVEVDRDAVPADGRTPVHVVVRVYDRADRPLAGRAFVTIESSGGRVRLPGAPTDELGPGRRDADRATPGVQLAVDGGEAAFDLVAPFDAQDVRLRVTAGREQAEGTIGFVPEMREMIAAGLIEGVVNFRRPGDSVIQPARSADGFDQEIDAWSRQFDSGRANVASRAAFYLKGTIRGDLLLTAGYDSDKDTRTRLLRDIRPEEFYPVYGDASLRSFDARSTSRLYVRVDRDRDYVLYGDFVTGDGFTQPIGQGAVASLRQRSLGAYNRTATGVRLHHDDATSFGNVVGNVFAFNDSLRQVVEEFASQGSGPYGLRNNAVLEGSDKVEVIVRDRNQPSRIVSVRPLQRLVDYSFEPFSGRILLASFLSPITNQRDDAYGGSLENRLRFPLEVWDAVRAAWPAQKPMSVRISATDWIAGGTTGSDTVEIARTFKAHGCDLIDVSTGQTDPRSKPVYGRMYQATFAEQVRLEAGIATMAVGAVTTADQVNTLLVSGRADLVALGRPHMADPYFTLHAATETGYEGNAWPAQYLPGAQQAYSLGRRAREDAAKRVADTRRVRHDA